MNNGEEYRTLGWFLRCNLWSYGFWFGMLGGTLLYGYHFADTPLYWERLHIMIIGPMVPSLIMGLLIWVSLAYPSERPADKINWEWEKVYRETWDAMKYACDRLPTPNLREEFSQNVKKYIDDQLDKRSEVS